MEQTDMEQGTFDFAAEPIPAPVKLCECGCGKPAPISTRTDRHHGYIKGQPRRFIAGHHGHLNATLFVEVGQHFGWGVVTEAFVRIPPKGRTATQRGARLACDCGAEYVASITSLLDSSRLSCGCRRGRQIVDHSGQRYGRLLVIRRVDTGPVQRGGSTQWLCLCDCGNETTVTGNRLGSGKTKSCGCLKKRPRKGYALGEAARNRVIIAYRQAARNRGYAWELTDEDFFRLVLLECFYCGSPPLAVSVAGPYSGEFTYNGVDRKYNALGYTLDNVVTACKFCNYAKKDMSFDEFMAWIGRLTAHQWFRPDLTPSRLLAGGV